MKYIPTFIAPAEQGKPLGSKTLQVFIFLLILFGGTQSFAGKTHIKFATLAPEGSSWMKQMREFSKQISKETNGEVALKFYPGGVSGDEKDVIRKMRIGQLHAAGFTGVGLGEILPEVRVLDLPFLFNTDEEVQHIYKKMNAYFAKRFEEKGYVLIGWVPVGWIHFFSKNKISSVKDLRQSKAWMWEGDPLVKATYQSLNVSPHPLSVTDVLMSLQTGMIDTVYASSMGALALQWFTKVKYISQLRMGYATGGVLMRKKVFDRLPKNHQATIISLGEKYMNKLVKKIQEDNDKAMGVMQKNGLQSADYPTDEKMEIFLKAGEKVRKSLTGKVFPQKLLTKVLTHLEEVKN
jgi:TRAP-type C4-dicarboxylate transport system substrate-binding protein